MSKRGGRFGGKFQGKKRKFHGNQGKFPHKAEGFVREMINVQEVDVGITEFVGDSLGFSGIIKCKFSDFQVNEIDLDGNVVKLTDTSVPECQVDKLPDNGESLLSAEDLTSLRGLLENSDKEFLEIDVTEMSKEQRTQIHAGIREEFGQKIIANTISKEERKFIKCFKPKKNGRDQERTRWLWPHQYIYFVLHKMNIDTMKAASALASSMRIKPSLLTYAGTKDKRALTSQLFCVKRREPAMIMAAAKRTNNIEVGNFTSRPEVLKLGQLRGNRFRIALKEITADPQVIGDSLLSFREKGFINYYGLQRFGNSAVVPTFTIGRALLKGQWLEACELILKPRPGDLPDMQRVRECWWESRDAKKALALVDGHQKCIEIDLLRGMSQHGANDLVGALEKVPRNTRLLYIHSYQSLIWNRIASKRFKLGLKPLPGDLVYREEASEVAEKDLEDTIDEEESDEEEDCGQEESKFKNMVKRLTEEEAKSGNYSIFDVVLPLPGHDITYPNNQCGEWYQELLATDDLSSEKLKQKVKTYSLGGTYRKFMAKPENLTWSLMKYNSTNDLLLASDVDEMRNKVIPEDPNGTKTALLLDFCLPSSTYATMALREVLKTDTSTAAQIKLNPKENSPDAEAVKKAKV
ncbi:pseudouridylate synthase 7 homolog [Phlebotomus argentipes]|uniref:pseudouridylate synthase 7 homolog n=1 Tax=Phlebotomus argentipes TaxID=94469 RepID=UPI002892E353|nr:pseudouridylate synthase 7 homolog [Phlebotomus argentipes]